MAGEWGLSPWGGEAPSEAAGAGTGFWGNETTPPRIENFSPPCGTSNLRTDQAISFDVVDPSQENAGIDLNNTTITLRINGGSVVTVFTGGSFQSGWTGSSTTPIVGPPPGYTFSLVRDTSYPNSSELQLTIITTNNNGISASKVCIFTVLPELGFSSVEFLGVTRIRVNFNTPLKHSDLSKVTNIENWSVRPIAGSALDSSDNLVNIKAVDTENARNPRFVILFVSKLIPFQRYEIRVSGFSDIFNRELTKTSTGTGQSRSTKLDSLFNGLPPMWEGNRLSDLFWLLGAIADQDEKIGGAQGIVQPNPLKRNF